MKRPTTASWYLLDAADRIIDVSPDWDDAAAQGRGEASAFRASVVGQPLRRFLLGDTTRMFLASALQAARLIGVPRQLDYRCDTPDQARKMTMRLVPLSDGQVRVEHQVVQSWARKVPLRFEGHVHALAPGWGRCSVCLWLRSPDGHWQDPEGQQLAWPLAVDYTVCPRCRAEIELRLRLPDTRVSG